jgi:hypothetical protein
LDDGQASRSPSGNISSHWLQIEIERNYEDTLPKLLGSEYYYIETFLQHTIIYYVMSDKNKIQEPGLGTEDAKKFELNEKPKPTRKVSHPSTPISNKDEPSTHDKRKGRRIVK